MKKTIGIPRALLYYRYHVFWESFFNKIGCNTIISNKTTKETSGDKTTETTKVKNVTVRINVDDEDVYKQDVPENTEIITHTIKAKGVVDVKVFIDDIRYSIERMDMNSENTVLNVKK